MNREQMAAIKAKAKAHPLFKQCWQAAVDYRGPSIHQDTDLVVAVITEAAFAEIDRLREVLSKIEKRGGDYAYQADEVSVVDNEQRFHQLADLAKDASGPECWCATCRPIQRLEDVRMILCAACGNKRCPHATDHRNACTNSNEPGQVGSAYEHAGVTHG